MQRHLRALPHLQVVDLGRNRLSSLDVTGLNQLQSLDLRQNYLSDWPAGALDALALTSLNLSRNEFDMIPRAAFEPQYATLMAGIDLQY